MARVSMAQSEALQQEMKGLRRFKAEPGHSYRIVFPVDKDNVETMYAAPVHEYTNAKIKGAKTRCLKDYYPEDFYNADGAINPKYIDRATGKPMFDGSCPLCELALIAQKIANEEIEKFVEANPGMEEKTLKEKKREILGNRAAKFAELGRGFLVAVLATEDTAGMKLKLVEDIPASELMFLPMSNNQYDTKFKAALTQFDNKVNFTDLIFTYPEGTKQESVKNMTVNPSMKQSCELYPALKENIAEKLAKMDLDAVENQTFLFRPKSVIALRQETAGILEQNLDNLSPEARAELEEKISKNMLSVEVASAKDIASLMGEGSEETEIVEEEVAGDQAEGTNFKL